MRESENGHDIGPSRFRDDQAGRGHWVRCRCGWESELCATPVPAVAAGEQHVELRSRRPARPG